MLLNNFKSLIFCASVYFLKYKGFLYKDTGHVAGKIRMSRVIELCYPKILSPSFDTCNPIYSNQRERWLRRSDGVDHRKMQRSQECNECIAPSRNIDEGAFWPLRMDYRGIFVSDVDCRRHSPPQIDRCRPFIISKYYLWYRSQGRYPLRSADPKALLHPRDLLPYGCTPCTSHP